MLKKHNRNRSTKKSRGLLHSGFTLVEIITVLVVVSILATVSYSYYNVNQQKAEDLSIQSDVKEIRKKVAANYAFDPYGRNLEHSTSALYLKSMDLDSLSSKVGVAGFNSDSAIEECNNNPNKTKVYIIPGNGSGVTLWYWSHSQKGWIKELIEAYEELPYLETIDTTVYDAPTCLSIS